MNRMEQEIGLNSFLKKTVVVKFLDNETNHLTATTGVLVDFNEGSEDINGEETECFVAIASETDYERIPLSSVTKIFLKKDGN